jgi:hypothetical protein
LTLIKRNVNRRSIGIRARLRLYSSATAAAKGTREAFELVIARHGDDPLAEQARAELQRLSR